MGANLKIRSLGDCVRHQLDVGIECNVCGRFVVFSTAEWGSVLGDNLEMLADPLKCSNCGSRMHRVRPWHQCNRPKGLKLNKRRPMMPLYVAKPGRRVAR